MRQKCRVRIEYMNTFIKYILEYYKKVYSLAENQGYTRLAQSILAQM
jgi:hypothetical protein